MTIGNFFNEVFCAPYSIPIGLINYRVEIIFYSIINYSNLIN